MTVWRLQGTEQGRRTRLAPDSLHRGPHFVAIRFQDFQQHRFGSRIQSNQRKRDGHIINGSDHNVRTVPVRKDAFRAQECGSKVPRVYVRGHTLFS